MLGSIPQENAADFLQNPYVAKIRCHKIRSIFQKYIKENKKNVHGLQKIGMGESEWRQ